MGRDQGRLLASCWLGRSDSSSRPIRLRSRPDQSILRMERFCSGWSNRGLAPLPKWDRQGPGTAAGLLLTGLRGRLILLPEEAEEAPPQGHVLHGLPVRLPLLRLALLGPLLISCLQAQLWKASALFILIPEQAREVLPKGHVHHGLPVRLRLLCLALVALFSSAACQCRVGAQSSQRNQHFENVSVAASALTLHDREGRLNDNYTQGRHQGFAHPMIASQDASRY